MTEFSFRIQTNHYGIFFLHTLPLTIALKLEYALVYEFYAKMAKFVFKKYTARLLSMTLTSKRSAESHMFDVNTSKRRPDIMHKNQLKPGFLALVNRMEIPIGNSGRCSQGPKSSCEQPRLIRLCRCAD